MVYDRNQELWLIFIVILCCNKVINFNDGGIFIVNHYGFVLSYIRNQVWQSRIEYEIFDGDDGEEKQNRIVLNVEFIASCLCSVIARE